jgi:hypothetical protein
MAAIANGYLDGYTNNDAGVKRALWLEYFLWAIDVAYENWERPTAEVAEIYWRAGDKKTIAAPRVGRLLRELEREQVD